MKQPATKLRVVTASDPATLSYSFERMFDTWEEFPPLFKQFIKEVGPRPDQCPFDLKWDVVSIGNAQGTYQILHARNAEQQLVGFVFNLVGFPDKYKTTLHAQLDMVWLHPDYRKGWNAINMLKENEKQLRRLRVQRILVASPARFKNHTGLSLQRLFRFMGFKAVEIVYEKYVR